MADSSQEEEEESYRELKLLSELDGEYIFIWGLEIKADEIFNQI